MHPNFFLLAPVIIPCSNFVLEYKLLGSNNLDTVTEIINCNEFKFLNSIEDMARKSASLRTVRVHEILRQYY